MALIFATARADPLTGDMLSADKVESPSLRAILSKDKENDSTTKFGDDAPKIRAFWKGKSLKAGDTIHAVWIAADVGPLASKDSKITEAGVTAYKSDDDGVFALARPESGWPLGKYRLELYLNGKLAVSIDFTIEKGVTIEVGRPSD